MALLTKTDLRKISDSMPTYRSASMLYFSAHSQDRNKYDTSVFLSHSHLDADYVKDVVAFLRNRGVSCYVDWMDESMPEKTSGLTAVRIKEKITSNDKFIFLATNNSIASKWCNWEIGYGDAKKYMDKIAIFPLKESNGDWKGNEYLQIYPYIYESDISKGTYWVKTPDGKVIRLDEWLRRK